MRQPDNSRDARLFDEIYSNPSRAAKAVAYTVYIDDIPTRVSSLTAQSAADAPAVALTASVPAPLAQTSIRKEVRVELRIEGSLWVDYEGVVQTLGDDSSAGSSAGSFGASTAGYYQGGEDAIKFNDEAGVEFTGKADRALYSMLTSFPYHRIRMLSFPAQDFVRQGPEAYPLMAPVGEAIKAVCEEASVVQKDSFINEALVFPAPSIGGIVDEGESVRWRVGNEITSFSADLINSAQFRDVGVTKQDSATGKYVSLVKPRPEVRYPPGVDPPPERTTYWEEITEDIDPTINARSLAAKIAAALSFGGEHSVSFTTRFIDPRVEDFDVRDVFQHNYATGVTTLYKVLIESQTRDYTNGTVTYSGTGVILDRVESRTDRRPILPQGARL